ncbi:MAG: DNA-processing protein DprA, partial [Pseudomonadota bacterium]
LEAERVIGIVGARNASAVGTKVATMLASGLAARGFAVISGLARGIDTAAHTATLEGEGDTAAVLAGGVDHIYPAENTALYHRIADHGLLLSEMPMRFEPQARNFPRRNRIISGMAEGVLVIEAAERSGSLITARYAGEQGREAMAVPGNPLDPRAGGCNRLIREGAALIRHVEDVVEALAGLASHIREPSASYGAPATRIDQDLAALRQRLLDLLSPAPIETDELVRQARASPAEVAWALMELELAGAVTREPGGRVSRLL